MRKSASFPLLAAAGILALALPGQASGGGWHGHGHRHGHGHGWHPHPGGARVFLGVGPVFPLWWGPRYGWGIPPAWAYPAPPVLVEEPPVYIQRPEPEASWYYCSSAGAYYPSVPACPEPWLKVPPRSE